MTDGGEGASGYKLTEEHKDKIRQSKIGNKNPNYGKKLSDEICKKMSNSRSGNKHYLFGQKITDEMKKRLSEASKGKLIGGKHHQAKKVINIETDEIYDTIKEVAELLGIKYSTLRAKLTGQNKNNTNYKLL